MSTGFDNGGSSVRQGENPMDRRPIAVPVIIAINVLIFLAWQAARLDESLEQVMAGNFLVSTNHLLHGHWWTLLTAAFSHMDFWHIALNMFVLWSFGTILEKLWGTRVFVVFYLVASVVASATHCFVSSVLMGNPNINALGASGAVSGLLLAFALLFPRHRILVFGVIPVPALVGALAFVAIDLWGLFAQSRGGVIPIGHGAHLGGAPTGACMSIGTPPSQNPCVPGAARIWTCGRSFAPWPAGPYSPGARRCATDCRSNYRNTARRRGR